MPGWGRSIATGLSRNPVGGCYSAEMRRPASRSTAHDPTYPIQNVQGKPSELVGYFEQTPWFRSTLTRTITMQQHQKHKEVLNEFKIKVNHPYVISAKVVNCGMFCAQAETDTEQKCHRPLRPKFVRGPSTGPKKNLYYVWSCTSTRLLSKFENFQFNSLLPND